MPDVELPLASGGATILSQRLTNHRGAVVLFWSGMCAHCARYDEYLNTFEQRHPEIALLAIAARHTETLQQIRLTVADRGLTFPIAHCADGRAAAGWQAPQTPRAYLVDRHRMLRYRGAIDNYKYRNDAAYAEYLEPAIDDFLHGRPIVRAETPSFGCAIDSIYYALPRVTR